MLSPCIVSNCFRSWAEGSGVRANSDNLSVTVLVLVHLHLRDAVGRKVGEVQVITQMRRNSRSGAWLPIKPIGNIGAVSTG